MKNSNAQSAKVLSGLLYYEKNASLFSAFFVSKHNAILANPRIIIAELKKCGKVVSRFSVLRFLESYGFNRTETNVVLSFLRKVHCL